MAGRHAPRDGELPVLPLLGVVFPRTLVRLHLASLASLHAARAALDTDHREVWIVAQRDAHADDPAPGDLYEVGCAARLRALRARPDGGAEADLEVLERARVVRWAEGAAPLRAQLTAAPFPGGARVGVREQLVIDELARRAAVAARGPFSRRRVLRLLDGATLAELIGVVCAQLDLATSHKQALLESDDEEGKVAVLLHPDAIPFADEP
jgi:ATP-dependent Lon protease